MHRGYKSQPTATKTSAPSTARNVRADRTESANRRLARVARGTGPQVPVKRADEEKKGSERRRYRRARVAVTAVLEAQGCLPRPVEIRELSPTGARVGQLAGANLRAGELVRLRFELTGAEVALVCRVAWVARDGRREFGGSLLLELSGMADRIRYANWIVAELKRLNR